MQPSGPAEDVTHTDAVPERVAELAALLERRAPLDASLRLRKEPDAIAAAVLERVNAVFAFKILQRIPTERRAKLMPLINRRLGEQWLQNQSYPAGSVGRLMGPPGRTSLPTQTVAECVEELREIARTSFFTYVYVVEGDRRLVGVVTMRDLLLADQARTLAQIMIREPFHFRPEKPVHEAAREVVHLHYPLYPVCDERGKLVGLVRGYVLFEESAEELSAQAGRMVGVAGEEHIDTPWPTSLRLRHPWLQLNLLTALTTALVVGLFQDLIAQVVVLAVFLNVLSSQAGNTGCQAMAVTVRGMTLDEFEGQRLGSLLRKEAWLGLVNGSAVGVSAAGAIALFALFSTGAGSTLSLALVTLLAMAASCVIAGVTGVLVPYTLRKYGGDPSAASAIVLTTFTDVASMSLLLGLAAMLLRR